MKYLIKYNRFLIVLIFPLLMVMCMSIESITHPENPQVDSEIEISVKVKLATENDDNTKMIFAVLAPKSWNIAENAVLTFTTNGYSKGNVINETMTVVSGADTEPTTGESWSAAIQSRMGLMDNYGPVEWVVFESQTTFNITDEEDPLVTADVKINLTTGSDNIKVFMGYFFCGKNRGFHEEYYSDNAKSKILETSGGSNALIDYTTVGLYSTTPASYGFNDVFAINFVSEAGGSVTELKGNEKVYLNAKAMFANGNDSSIVEVISDKTLMNRLGETSYQKYIYPKEFFGLPNDASITEIYFYFTNEDRSVKVAQASGDDFMITESCE